MTSEKKLDDLEAIRLIVDTLSDFDKNDQERIVRWVLEKTELKLTGGGISSISSILSSVPSFASSNPAPRSSSHPDIKSFTDEKDPKSDNQFAAAVAYFYKFEAPAPEKKDAISPQDLLDACRLAGRKRMGDPSKTLANAQSVGLLNKVDRGQYSISSVGENLVALTLPENISGKPFEGKKAKGTKKARKAASKKSR